MKNHFKALVISNQNVSTKVLNWNLEIMATIEDALANIQCRNYRVIAVDETFDESDRRKLQTIAKLFNKDVSIVNFSNNENLESAIKQAFRIQKMASLKNNYLDNAFEIELAYKLNMN